MAKKKPRVLVADDETQIRALMKAIMTGMNCEVMGRT